MIACFIHCLDCRTVSDLLEQAGGGSSGVLLALFFAAASRSSVLAKRSDQFALADFEEGLKAIQHCKKNQEICVFNAYDVCRWRRCKSGRSNNDGCTHSSGNNHAV